MKTIEFLSFSPWLIFHLKILGYFLFCNSTFHVFLFWIVKQTLLLPFLFPKFLMRVHLQLTPCLHHCNKITSSTSLFSTLHILPMQITFPIIEMNLWARSSFFQWNLWAKFRRLVFHLDFMSRASTGISQNARCSTNMVWRYFMLDWSKIFLIELTLLFLLLKWTELKIVIWFFTRQLIWEVDHLISLYYIADIILIIIPDSTFFLGLTSEWEIFWAVWDMNIEEIFGVGRFIWSNFFFCSFFMAVERLRKLILGLVGISELVALIFSRYLSLYLIFLSFIFWPQSTTTQVSLCFWLSHIY